MQDKPKSQNSESRNEGEGNRTAARAYNKAQQEFVKSGKVDEKARAAERALSGDEKPELRRAEVIGKSHNHGEDPAVRRKG